MRQRFGWFKRLFGDGEGGPVLQIFTPRGVASRGAGTKLTLAAVTVGGLAVAGTIAVGSFLMLLFALGALYFLLTQVLGIRLDVDPRAFVEQAQKYAQHPRN